MTTADKLSRTLAVAAAGFCSISALLFSSQAMAWSDVDRIREAQALGNLLASEDFCNITYNQTAIETYIDSAVPDNDMQFPSMLTLMTDSAKFNFEDMSPSQKTAHCAQIKRVAKAHDFLQ